MYRHTYNLDDLYHTLRINVNTITGIMFHLTRHFVRVPFFWFDDGLAEYQPRHLLANVRYDVMVEGSQDTG